jgi:superfamily I DNA/RNA helicase
MKPQAAYECNGALIAPEAFYAIACDPQRSVAVEACAGAGKTWMLVSRMVRALLEDANQAGPDDALQPQEILAITFTKRAAGEMRERLYEWLADFARADNATLLKELQIRGVPGLNNEAIAQRLTAQLQGLYARMLASGRSVQIRTFHGWFAALLRSAPVAVLQNLSLPVNYELLEDDGQQLTLWHHDAPPPGAWSEVLRCITSIYRQDFRTMIIPSKDITAGLCVYKVTRRSQSLQLSLNSNSCKAGSGDAVSISK